MARRATWRRRATPGASYGRSAACRSEIERGETVGLIGRNGAGKSTLLKLLSRITLPTEGRITLRGRVATLLEVGTGFHPELSGRENIFVNGAILGMRRREIEAKFDDIVEFSGIERFIDTPVKRYSSGMFVRLAFAVAAHLDPEILLVDEVLAVGDAEFQRKCLGKMQEVSEHGRTVVFVSHNLSAVQRLCSTRLLDRRRPYRRRRAHGVGRCRLHARVRTPAARRRDDHRTRRPPGRDRWRTSALGCTSQRSRRGGQSAGDRRAIRSPHALRGVRGRRRRGCRAWHLRHRRHPRPDRAQRRPRWHSVLTGTGHIRDRRLAGCPVPAGRVPDRASRCIG